VRRHAAQVETAHPCILLEARLAYKAGEIHPAQERFDFQEIPSPVLRAVHVRANQVARKAGIHVIPHFRVPASSVIYRVFHEGLLYAEAVEELSSGGVLAAPVGVGDQPP
jgi:hypothetical protein